MKICLCFWMLVVLQWLAREKKIGDASSNPTTIRFDIKSTTKTKVIFKQILVSRSGYISV